MLFLLKTTQNIIKFECIKITGNSGILNYESILFQKYVANWVYCFSYVINLMKADLQILTIDKSMDDIMQKDMKTEEKYILGANQAS